MPYKYTYRRLTADEFSKALDAVSDATGQRFSKGQFVRLTGMHPYRVDDMLHGVEGADIPHMVTVLMAILSDPEIGRDAMTVALRVTDAMIEGQKRVGTSSGKKTPLAGDAPPSPDSTQGNRSLGERMVKGAKEAREIARRGGAPLPDPDEEN